MVEVEVAAVEVVVAVAAVEVAAVAAVEVAAEKKHRRRPRGDGNPPVHACLIARIYDDATRW